MKILAGLKLTQASILPPVREGACGGGPGWRLVVGDHAAGRRDRVLSIVGRRERRWSSDE
jgi:hypothetical protein